MQRSRKALLVALALALGAVQLTPQPAQAHGGSSAVAGIVVGAVVGSIIASSIIRHKHRKYRYY